MAITIEGTTTGSLGDAGGDTTTLTSWTPQSNELILLAVGQYDESIAPTASGNGITFDVILDLDNAQNNGGMVLMRGMSASPTTGSITVTHTGNSAPTMCIATRISGVDTGGTNGSAAIGNTASDAGPPVTDNDDCKVSVTIDSNDIAFAAAYHRIYNIDDPPGSDDTTILLNQTTGTGGQLFKASVWYDEGSGSIQLGDDNDLGGANDWCIIGVEVNVESAGPDVNVDRSYADLDNWTQGVRLVG
jgi:hypothetical protein